MSNPHTLPISVQHVQQLLVNVHPLPAACIEVMLPLLAWHLLCCIPYRVFQQQFCQIGKPVVVRGIRPGFLWDPDTLQRATIDLKGTYGVRRNKSDRKVQKQAPRPLTVSCHVLPAYVLAYVLAYVPIPVGLVRNAACLFLWCRVRVIPLRSSGKMLISPGKI